MKQLRITFRTLGHYRLYSGINIAGLAVCLACVIIISRYVYNELTVDGFNSKLDRLYVSTSEQSNRPDKRFSGVWNPNNEKSFKDLLEHPGIEKHSRIMPFDDQDVNVKDYLYTTKIMVVDSVFLQITDYPVAGAANFARPEDVFITEEYAMKTFGNKYPLGEKLIYSNLNKELTVAGIIGKPKTKSVISFDMLVSSQLMPKWYSSPQTLALLYPGVDYRDINKQYSDFMEMTVWHYSMRFQLFPYKDVYFENSFDYASVYKHGNSMYVLILSIVGMALLLIGLVNYINIYTVVILRRNKEFGMKKVFGAEGYKIFFQLILENMILILSALLIAFALSELFNPVIARFMDIEEIINTRFDFLMSAALLVTLPVLTSITPFVRYHYASPVKSLQTIGIGGKSLFSRKFFLCLQYFVTMVMIVVSMFFVKQLNFMLGQDLGYRTENIIKVPFLKPNYNIAYLLSQEEQKAIQDKNKQITDELQQKLDASPLLENWVQGVSPNNANREVGFSAPGGERLPTTLVGANAKWLKLFDIKIKEGHSWDDENPFVYVMLAGESILKQYGITDYNDAELTPESRLWYALGRGIAQDEMAKNPPYHIIGIVKDFYTSHLSKKQNPVTIYYAKGHFEQPIIAAFLPENKKAVIAFMKSLHDELVGGDFTFTFIEDEIAETYKDDRKVAVIYSIFTGIAILVSILGLFGLSLFDIQERRKEIAIRKVNGASTFDIIRLLLKKYFTLLGIAFVVSVPVALFAIHKYLENFAMKAPVSWWLFAIALIVTVAVSMLTLIYQTHKASNENPAEVVKS